MVLLWKRPNNCCRQICLQTSPQGNHWQSYVDDALMKTGQVSKAAIHALDGARWASSPDFKVHSCRSIGSRRPVGCIRMGWEQLG